MAAGKEVAISQLVLDRYFKAIFKSKLTTDIELAYYKEVYGVLAEGVDKGLTSVEGFSPVVVQTDAMLRHQLRTNAAVFSAFKNHSFKQELVKLLVNEEGDVRAWESFKEEAGKLSDEYNKRWLKTEYDLAVGSSNMAAKWQDFQKRKHLYPNLKYSTAGDERVRELHKNWDGIILPIDHPFWKTHYPPNDWGCRCDAYQTDEDEDTKKVNIKELPDLPKQFNKNSGIEGEIFDEKHPYGQDIPKSKKSKIKKEAGKLVDLKPDNFNVYEKATGAKLNDNIFKMLPEPILLQIKNSSGCYYQPSQKTVSLHTNTRNTRSKWKAESVVYHEFGHAIDWTWKKDGKLSPLKAQKEVTDLMEKYRKAYRKGYNAKYKEISILIEKMTREAYSNKEWDKVEQIGAVADTVMSLNKNFGYGHTKAYFKHKGMSEAEFIAHSFENYYAGNPIFKELLPDLYKDTVNLVKAWEKSAI